ncbi:Golgin subfamily A member 7/ERF4 family-domain-containing protein [Gongronella butleri]|nr:Golgin subfamily A member 7/ERF4 family-domain-containing protein [Gongronella butleri]
MLEHQIKAPAQQQQHQADSQHQHRRHKTASCVLQPYQTYQAVRPHRLSCTIADQTADVYRKPRPQSWDSATPLVAMTPAWTDSHMKEPETHENLAPETPSVPDDANGAPATAATTQEGVPRASCSSKAQLAIDMNQYVATKAVRIERDYSKGDGITQFCTEMPMALDGKVTPEQFKHTIHTINALLLSAEKLSWSGVMYNMMEILTIYLWPLLFDSHYQKTIHALLDFIDKENQDVYHKQQLSIRNPVKTAFLFLEIQVFE